VVPAERQKAERDERGLGLGAIAPQKGALLVRGEVRELLADRLRQGRRDARWDREAVIAPGLRHAAGAHPLGGGRRLAENRPFSIRLHRDHDAPPERPRGSKNSARGPGQTGREFRRATLIDAFHVSLRSSMGERLQKSCQLCRPDHTTMPVPERHATAGIYASTSAGPRVNASASTHASSSAVPPEPAPSLPSRGPSRSSTAWSPCLSRSRNQRSNSSSTEK